MLNYKKPIKVKSKLMENEQVTIAPADTKTQVIKAGNKTIGTVSNPTVANQLKTAIQKGEVNLAQDLKEEAPPDQEQWIKDNKEKFIKQYGKKGEAILYATAWQRHNKGVKESKINEALNLVVLKGTKGYVKATGKGKSSKLEYKPIYTKNIIEAKRFIKDSAELNEFIEAMEDDREFFKQVPYDIKQIYGGEVNKFKESKELDLDKLFESVAFDEPDPVSHILSKFKFEVNQFCQGQQINPDLYDCLYDYYLDAGLMPYGVAKARDANPIEWVSDKLKEYLGQCGVSQQTSQPVDSPIEVQNAQPVPEYGDDIEQQVSSEPTEQEIDQMFESILGKPLTSKIKESKMPALTPQQRRDPKFIEKLVSQAMIKFFEAKGFSKVKDTLLEKEIGPNYVTVEIEKSRGYETYTYQDEIFNAPPMVIKLEMDGKTLSEKSVDGVEPDSLQKLFTRTYEPLTSKIKESKMKVTQPKRKQVAESSIDRKSKLVEAVDPKSVYIVVKNVPRLRGIKCDIGITYELSYDPDDDVFSAVAVKFVDMETGQKYAQTQFQELAYKQLMLFADKDATKRANDNDLEPQDFSESGRQKPIVKEILKASKTVTRDFFANVSESSIDRKARQLVDSWNLKLKQKLKESPEYKQGDTVTLGSGFLKGKKAKIVKIDGQWLEVNPDGEAKDFVIKVKKSDLVESTQKRKLREGVSISTSQSQGFGYDEIDGNTSINVCATGEDAIRLAEILRDAGFGQFKQSHIAVPQQTIVGDYHDDAGEVQQPEYDPMPEYDESQPEVKTHHDDGEDESQLLDRIKQFVSYGAETPVKEITEAEEMEDSEVVVYNGKLGIVVDADTGADNEYEVMFADGTEVISGTDLEPATQAQIDTSKDIVKYIGDDAQFAGRYGVIIEEDGDEYHVAFSDGETWIVGTDLEAPALQESFANEYQMNEPAKTNYMTHGISGGLNSLRRSQATGNVTRISTMESKGKGHKLLKESKQAVGKPSDELASMANLVEAISVQQRIKFGG